MGAKDHRESAEKESTARCAILTVTDSKTIETDTKNVNTQLKANASKMNAGIGHLAMPTRMALIPTSLVMGRAHLQ